MPDSQSPSAIPPDSPSPAPTSPRAREVLAWLAARQDEMVELTALLARLESPSRVPAAQGPVFDLLAEALAGSGYAAKRLAGRAGGGGQLLAAPPRDRRRMRGRPLQVLLGHVDTVWPVGTLAAMPVELRGGRLYGPGVFDMKAGLAQGVYALKALAALGIEPPATPAFFVVSDEEVGSTESTRRIRWLARAAARVFVLEPALGPAGALKTARKGTGRFTVVVRGRAAHSGLDPERGASAIHELAGVVGRLAALADPARGVTVNVGVIAGGVAANVVAPEARAEVDVRVLRQADGAAVERAIRALSPGLAGTAIEVRGGMVRPPLEPTPGNRALWHSACKAAMALGMPLAEGTAGGASDGNTASLLAPTLDGLGAVGDGAHAAHEHVEVARMAERAALLALLLAAESGE